MASYGKHNGGGGRAVVRSIMGSNITRKADQQHKNIKLIVKLTRNKLGILVPVSRVMKVIPSLSRLVNSPMPS